MSINLIMDKTHEPSMDEIASYIEENARKMWQETTSFIETNFKAKQQIAYSICSGKPGWNVKYKKGGKALCTLYPEKDFFIALVVLGRHDRTVFDITREDYCGYITDLYDTCTLFNGTKWLMINVTDENIFEDVKRLIKIKAAHFFKGLETYDLFHK